MLFILLMFSAIKLTGMQSFLFKLFYAKNYEILIYNSWQIL